MARIAESACATCHQIKPRTEMREVPVNRRTSSRVTVSHSRNGNRETASAGYTRKMMWVCRGCPAPKSDGLLPWKTIMFVVVLAVGYSLYAGAHPKQHLLPKAALPIVSSITPSVAMAAVAGTSHDGDRADDETTEPAKHADADSGGQGTFSAAPEDVRSVDWTQPAIADATAKALDKGKAQTWHENGFKGYAVVSEPTTTGEQECRSVYVTAKGYGQDLKSPTAAWCRTGGGDWQLR